jgi:penicillin-binding protein 1C
MPKDINETQTFSTVEGPKKNGRRNGKSGKNGKNGKGSKHEVPSVTARIGPDSEVQVAPSGPEAADPSGDPLATQAIEHVPASNGNGASKKPEGVPHVKVRVGGAQIADEHASNGSGRFGNGHSNGLNGGETRRVPPLGQNGNGNGNGFKARVSPSTPADSASRHTTSGLRDTDITGLRLKLKRQEWSYTPAGKRQVHKRALPYFLMRHRVMRSRSTVGHTRARVAGRKYKKVGILSLALYGSLSLVLLMIMLFGAGVGGAFAGTLWYMENKLPPVTEIHGINVQTTKIYDRNGIPLFDLVDEETGRRREVRLSEISPLIISATIAAEDATFYSNPGVEPVALLRAVYINYSGSGSSGASTITQQVVRNVNLPDEEASQITFSRKIREMLQALRFARYYSKDEILEMYLNENNYGERAYGIEAAALTYFGKSAKDVTLAEAALLAGLPQQPTTYNPFVNPSLAKARQAIVLDLMAKQEMITQDEANAAKSANIVLRPYTPPARAQHFVYYVKEYLEQVYGPDVHKAGLVVTTTLDLRVQEAAEKVARDRIDELRRQKATNAAIVVMKPNTGEILAMVGSVDYNDQSIDGQVNVATRERQPGSSFKPITFVTAFKKGWTPGTVLLDTWTSFPNPGQAPYQPKNYDGRDHGWVSVRDALANSYNVPAVKALQFAGIQNTIDTAHEMGIKGLNRGTDWYGLSLTLGGGEVTLLDMTTAYSTFANGGAAVDANPILQIEQPGVGVIRRLDPEIKSKAPQVLDPRHAYMITDILSDNRARTPAFGPSSPLRLPFQAAAKTGTTDDNRDSWTLGYTPDLTVGVWVGNSNNDEMLKVTGAIGAAVVWNNMMRAFYDNPEFVELVGGANRQKEFTKPDGLITRSACSNKGTVTDLFLREAPPKGCTTYKDNNKQLRAAPNNNNNNNNNNRQQQPQRRTTPTPLPGIWPPLNTDGDR